MVDTDALRNALDIVEVIGEVVQLRKQGQNYFGLCPFHSEKSPSFSVSAPKQLYHCFGCKAGGDVLHFYKNYHRVDFPTALEDLAKRAGIEIKKTTHSGKFEEAAALTEKVCLFFEESLQSKAAAPVREYLKARGTPKEIQERFRLGWHPGGDPIVDLLKREKLSIDLAAQLGLITKKEGRLYDRFRGRLMFSVSDDRGRVRGFGGRSLGEEKPKYLNSPASFFFDKKQLLYGMQFAALGARQKGYIVIVEGYFDVLALHEFNVINAVASMGTALTEMQARKIKRWSGRVLSLFDADDAGILATERNLKIFIQEGLEAKVVITESAKDIDAVLHDESVTVAGRKAKLRELFKIAEPSVDFLIRHKVDCHTDSVLRAKAARELMNLFEQVPDPIERSVLIKDCARKLGVSVELPKLKVSEPAGAFAEAPRRRVAQNKQARDWSFEILKFLALHGSRAEFSVAEALPYLSFSSKWSKILKNLLESGKSPSDLPGLNWLSDIDEESAAEMREVVLSNDNLSTSSVEDLNQIWLDLLRRMRQAYVQAEHLRIQNEIERLEADKQSDPGKLRQLLQEKKDLVELFKDQ